MAFREGLGVQLNNELISRIREWCSASKLQLIVCGVVEIDVEDWMLNTEYEGADASELAKWFWEIVKDEMTSEDRALLLGFCTGSTRCPSSGFANLMGFNGAEHKFTIHVDRGASPDYLPTASTCFSTLHLPCYRSKAELKNKLRQAMSGAEGFEDGD